MMKAIKKETKQSSLIHQKIRNASFMPLENPNTKRFKYNLWLLISKYFNKKLIVLRTFCNKIIQGLILWINQTDFKGMIYDSTIWFIEAVIEGVIINFIVWGLIGLDFNFITIIAWGFAIKQFLSIYWRLRKNGSNTTIPTKDK